MSLNTPKIFSTLLTEGCLQKSDITSTDDGFFFANKSISDLLLAKNIKTFLDKEGNTAACENFFDDWFLYALPNEDDYVYGLIKLREQENDLKCGNADGDTPGVTVSFISFNAKLLIDCFESFREENTQKLGIEINRVVAYKGQNHHKAIKKYFASPVSKAAYLVAELYVKRIASFSKNGFISLPEEYKKLASAHPQGKKQARVPTFIERLNQKAGYTVVDNEKIYIKDSRSPSKYEAAAILATHTGALSCFAFAAEVEYHAKYLYPLLKPRIPLIKKSIYDSAIRADITIGDTECEGTAPFHRKDSKIVKRQYALHKR